MPHRLDRVGAIDIGSSMSLPWPYLGAYWLDNDDVVVIVPSAGFEALEIVIGAVWHGGDKDLDCSVEEARQIVRNYLGR